MTLTSHQCQLERGGTSLLYELLSLRLDLRDLDLSAATATGEDFLLTCELIATKSARIAELERFRNGGAK